MSNARYFAGGTDFWRVLYPNESSDGPYIKASSAKRVGEDAIKVRQSWSYGPPATRVLLNEWQVHESYKLQKLGIVENECDRKNLCALSCFAHHGRRLDWIDYSA